MKRNNGKFLVVTALTVICVFLLANCNEPAQQPQPVVAAPAAPAPAPVVQPTPPPAPVAPPATPLMPVGEESSDKTESSSSAKKVGGGIDAPIPGAKTEGDELVGNYNCKIDSDKLKLGPFKAPPFGCKIFKTGDGALKLASTAEGAGSMKGDVKDSTAAGFFVVGTYSVAGNELKIKTRMLLKGEGKYVGKGKGKFNDDAEDQVAYTLTMTKN